MDRRIELDAVFQSDAVRLINDSKITAKTLRESGDIHAAGKHVEGTFAQILSRRLSPSFSVLNGHLVDAHHTTSPEVDFIVGPSSRMTSFLKTEDNTIYIPHEAACAIGEFKTSFYGSPDPLSKFSTNISMIEESMGPSVCGYELFLQLDENRLRRHIGRKLAFLVIGTSNSKTVGAITRAIKSTEGRRLPGLIYILDKGIVARRREPMDMMPDVFEPEPKRFELLPYSNEGWGLYDFPEASNAEGARFAAFHLLLLRFLCQSEPGAPDLAPYVSHFF